MSNSLNDNPFELFLIFWYYYLESRNYALLQDSRFRPLLVKNFKQIPLALSLKFLPSDRPETKIFRNGPNFVFKVLLNQWLFPGDLKNNFYIP